MPAYWAKVTVTDPLHQETAMPLRAYARRRIVDKLRRDGGEGRVVFRCRRDGPSGPLVVVGLAGSDAVKYGLALRTYRRMDIGSLHRMGYWF